MLNFVVRVIFLLIVCMILLLARAQQCSSLRSSTSTYSLLSYRNSRRNFDPFTRAFPHSEHAQRVVALNEAHPLLRVRGGACSASALQMLSPVVHDAAISAMVVTESLIWLKIWTTLAAKDVLDPKLSRKIIHSGSAPLFMAHWPLYSATTFGKFFAAGVPLLQVIR